MPAPADGILKEITKRLKAQLLSSRNYWHYFSRRLQPLQAKGSAAGTTVAEINGSIRQKRMPETTRPPEAPAAKVSAAANQPVPLRVMC